MHDAAQLILNASVYYASDAAEDLEWYGLSEWARKLEVLQRSVRVVLVRTLLVVHQLKLSYSNPA